ncbi:uncharacterized protein LY89DRAFT_692647 [Mollisia scopiformis]|uniref:Uncharacterized protein n=1 Tax=Mollisia scopiformis TaxID=149040 RepID=A0A132B1D2_MOLSC|nr:uncharacterized protein LY89DRAFT_692647 [Mollisia scopiformis]KUJ06185.1 hypothetical protein LY89DRAFT_692647 [Mollisia scopiformis]
MNAKQVMDAFMKALQEERKQEHEERGRLLKQGHEERKGWFFFIAALVFGLLFLLGWAYRH